MTAPEKFKPVVAEVQCVASERDIKLVLAVKADVIERGGGAEIERDRRLSAIPPDAFRSNDAQKVERVLA